MGAPQRSISGITNVPITHPLGNYGLPDPTKWITYFTDFLTYAAGDFTNTEVGTGTRALGAVAGGVLVVTNAAADNDGNFFQLVAAPFGVLVANKKAVFRARFKVLEILQADLVMGFQLTDTTPLDATDGIFFQKDDGDALLDIYVEKNTTTGRNSQAGVATLVADTFVTLGIYYDGAGYAHFYVDDARVWSLDASSTYFPDAAMNVSFGLQNGQAVANVLTVDHVLAAVER